MNKALLKSVGVIALMTGLAAGAFAQTAEEYYNRGKGSMEAGDWDQAVTAYTQGIRLNANYTDAYNGRAYAYYFKGDYDRAIADASQVLRLTPNHIGAYYVRGLSYLGKGDNNRAIADFTQGIRLDPNDPDFYRGRGKAYYFEEQYDPAIADLTQVMKLDPNNAEAYNFRGLAYYDKEDNNRAIADFTQAIRIAPAWSMPYHNRGKAYFFEEQYDPAIADFTQAMKLDLKYAETYALRGEAYRIKGQYDPAIKDFSEAVKLAPNYAFAYGSRGQTYRQKGQRSQAIADLEKALSINPNLQWVQDELEAIRESAPAEPSPGRVPASTPSQQSASGVNPSEVRQTVRYTLRDSVDTIGNKYISFASQRPSVMTFVNSDGSVSVCAADESGGAAFVYEYSKDMVLLKTLTFKNERANLGAFTKDSAGNYYFFYAEPAKTNEQENMMLVKYNAGGVRQKSYTLKAYADNSFHGIQSPFEAGTCRLELSGSMLAVYFARKMFDGHQSSYGFAVNKDTFERVDKGAAFNAQYGGMMIMPYVSHSFNQFILPIDNGFLFADHGDAYPRGFTFAKFQNSGDTKRLQAFPFEGAVGENATYAQMGGLVKTSKGYLFAGAYGKNNSTSRNVFILTFDDALTSCSQPVYLTKYTAQEGHAAHPKIVSIGSGRYLLLWELCEFSNQPANQITSVPTGYTSTYMLIIDEQGKPLSPVKELPKVRLNMNDTLRYNPAAGKVYWSINYGKQNIFTYALDPNGAITFQFAEMEASPGDFEFKREGQSITITKYVGTMTNLIIPKMINGLPVTSIAEGAFSYSGITSVVFPPTLTVIGPRSFWYSRIQSLTIPATVQSVGAQAFSDCPDLVSVTLPDSSIVLDSFVFLRCPKLKSVTIPAGLKSLGYGTFQNCPSLDSATKAALARFNQ